VPESPSLSYHSRRTSTASGLSVWYDAPEPDGALEFVMDSAPSGSRFADEGEAPTEQGDEEDEGDDTDEESNEQPSTPPADVGGGDAKAAERAATQIVRRTQLPSGPVADEGSLFSVLKKNVGKVSLGFLSDGSEG
jgi:hypothetical protein